MTSVSGSPFISGAIDAGETLGGKPHEVMYADRKTIGFVHV